MSFFRTRVRALQGSALHLGNFLLEISCEMSSKRTYCLWGLLKQLSTNYLRTFRITNLLIQYNAPSIEFLRDRITRRVAVPLVGTFPAGSVVSCVFLQPNNRPK